MQVLEPSELPHMEVERIPVGPRQTNSISPEPKATVFRLSRSPSPTVLG
jgi:hypothetical protein